MSVNAATNLRKWSSGVMVIMALTGGVQAQERTAFVCEGRIGNAATSPDAALRGDFEYDIGTNTAAPSATGQFQWFSGSAVPFEIVYDGTTKYAWFRLGTDPDGWIYYGVANDVFEATNAVANLNGRVRSVQTGSSVTLDNLTLTTSAGSTNLPAMQTQDNNQTLCTVSNQLLQAGFTLTGNAVFAWDAAHLPGRSQLAFQLSAAEPQQVVKVEWEEDNAEDDVGLQPGNPATHGGGMRFYAEKNRPDGPVHTKVKAVAKLLRPVPIGGSATVWFKVFDMDDPTFNENDPNHVVDKNDERDAATSAWVYKGNDNRPSAGGLTARRKGTAAGWVAIQTPQEYEPVALAEGQDTAIVEYEVTAPRPGNNWKVVAHLDGALLADAEIDTSPNGKGQTLRRTSQPSEILPGTVQSPLLSVWRTIWMEIDSMGFPVGEPFGLVTGTSRVIEQNWLQNSGLGIWRPGSLEGGVLNPTGADSGNSVVWGQRFEVSGNGLSLVYTRDYQYLLDGFDNDGDGTVDESDEIHLMLPLSPSNLPFAIDTDDAPWLDPLGLNPPETASIINDCSRYYAPAFIRCLELQAARNPRSVHTFYRNTDAHIGEVDAPGDESYWTACICWAYEDGAKKRVMYNSFLNCGKELYDGDNDPEGEGVETGHRATREGSAKRVDTVDGRFGDQVMIWCESIRDIHGAGYSARVAMDTAHEMAHLFGLEHNICDGPLLPGIPLSLQTGYSADRDGIMLWDSRASA